MKKPLISLKIFGKDSEKVDSLVSRKRRRIYAFLKADNFKDCTFNVRVRYEYGLPNEGTYATKKELIHALKAFLE